MIRLTSIFSRRAMSFWALALSLVVTGPAFPQPETDGGSPPPLSRFDFTPPRKADPPPEVTPEKVHPRLAERLGRPGSELGGKEWILISFKDELAVPRLESLDRGQPLSSPENLARAQRNEARIDTMRQQRTADHEERMATLGPRFGATLEKSYWLTDAILVRMPLASVAGLANHPDVEYVELAASGEGPPIGDGNALNDVIDGREEIQSDYYFNLGFDSGFIGLLDTGVRPTHVQFTNPSNLGFLRDCVNGTADDCTTGTNLDPSDNYWNHGTASAGIITANSNQGNDYRGVTAIVLDSFKIYNNVGLVERAALDAFEAAIAVFDDVIVAEIQGCGNYNSALSRAADAAYDAGVAVIAANGNDQSDGGCTGNQVASPANAHKAIGVGAVNINNLQQYSGQRIGPTDDGRVKPDIQTPTNTETASNQSDTALRVFSGTSGATPYAGAAAGLFRNRLISRNYSGSPGEIYVSMILAGNYPQIDNTRGAGFMIMPNTGISWRGSTTITAGESVDFPLNVGSGRSTLDGALWWPETRTQDHSDLDLYLISPSGTQYRSTELQSVFERAQASGSLSGTWTLRIYGYSVPSGSQTVFWAARAR